jgi:hypothetical protein
LSEQDVVTFHQDKMVVLFDDPKKVGTVRVKIAAEAISDMYGNLKTAVIDEIIAYNTPDVTGYFFSNAASEFIFEDNEEWRNNVREVIIYDDWNGTIRPLNSTEYTLTAGKLTINQGVFQKDIEYEIYINAEGYSSKYEYGMALPSTEIFYMTAPAITTTNGITATINVLHTVPYYNYDYDGGNQTVVFELMDGSTPVSIVSAELSVNTGTYAAKFNVTDAATNPDYTVRAFIVSEFNTDSSSVGINLAKQVTKLELDLKRIELENNDYYD